MSDLNFEQMLASYNQNYKEAEEFSDWMPPDGDYLCIFQAPKKGISEKKTPAMLWWKLTAVIEDPSNADVHGKEFQVGFYNSNAFGILKSATRSLNKGEPVSNLAEADKVLSGVEGVVAKVKVTTTVKDENTTYRNCYIQEVISAEETTDPSETAPETPSN